MTKFTSNKCKSTVVVVILIAYVQFLHYYHKVKNIFIVAVLFSSAINVLIYIHILTFYFIL